MVFTCKPTIPYILFSLKNENPLCSLNNLLNGFLCCRFNSIICEYYVRVLPPQMTIETTMQIDSNCICRTRKQQVGVLGAGRLWGSMDFAGKRCRYTVYFEVKGIYI